MTQRNQIPIPLKTKPSFLKIFILWLFLIGLVLYVPFIGSVHLFDWDEINFAESAREMIVSGNYLDVQINFETFWEKPPLFIWLQVLSMKLFGINEFAARFPNALVGISTLFALFFIGKKIKNETFGFVWAMTHAVAILPFLYFKSGIIDPLFNLFILLGIYQFVLFSNKEGKALVRLSLSAFWIGLGILTKGPVALLLFLLTGFIYLILQKKYLDYLKIKVMGIYAIVLVLVGGFWFFLQYINGNAQILSDFITYQIRLFSTKDAGHGGFLLYHFVVVLIGVFPASILALKGYKSLSEKESLIHDFHYWMKILMWVVLGLFTIVSTKIVHYSSMAYFPVSFLGAYFLYNWINGKIIFPKWLKMVLISIASLWTIGVVGITLIGLNAQEIVNSALIKDDFANANLLAKVPWTGFEMGIGILFLGWMVIALFKINDKTKAVTHMFLATVFFTYSTLIFIVPKIEGYSQNAALEFYKSHAGEQVYITTYGFKSYAPLFYAQKPMLTNDLHTNQEWILNGETDKPVFVVTKNIKEKEFFQTFPHFRKLYAKNGFVFFEKNPINISRQQSNLNK